MLKIICILLVASALAGCSLAAVNTKKADSPHVGPTTVQSRDGVFRLDLPDGWSETDKGELNEHADLEAKNASDAMYVAALMENKEDTTSSFDEYRDRVFRQSQTVYRSALGEPTDVKLGNCNGSVYEFDGVFDQSRFHMWLYVVESKRYYGQLMSWTTKSKAEKNGAALRKVV